MYDGWEGGGRTGDGRRSVSYPREVLHTGRGYIREHIVPVLVKGRSRHLIIIFVCIALVKISPMITTHIFVLDFC